MTLFVEGEPIDVTDLNNLNEKITKIEQTLNSLTTRYDTNNKIVDNIIPVITTGSQKFTKVSEGKTRNISIPRNAFLSTDPNPAIQVTAGGAVDNINFSISNISKTSFDITFHSKTPQDIIIYWMAVVERKIV